MPVDMCSARLPTGLGWLAPYQFPNQANRYDTHINTGSAGIALLIRGRAISGQTRHGVLHSANEIADEIAYAFVSPLKSDKAR